MLVYRRRSRVTNTYARWMTEDQGSIGIDGSRWAGSIYANNNRLVLVHLTVRVSALLRSSFKPEDIVSREEVTLSFSSKRRMN